MSDRELAERFLFGRPQLIVVKRGPKGSTAFAPGGKSWTAGIYPVDVKKNYGAGDAFAAAFIHGLLDGKEPDEAMRLGAGAAGLVVSNTACAASAPRMPEIAAFMASVKEEIT